MFNNHFHSGAQGFGPIVGHNSFTPNSADALRNRIQAYFNEWRPPYTAPAEGSEVIVAPGEVEFDSALYWKCAFDTILEVSPNGYTTAAECLVLAWEHLVDFWAAIGVKLQAPAHTPPAALSPTLPPVSPLPAQPTTEAPQNDADLTRGQ